ncbi:hypothetical protein SAY87_016749 [Trapa incisa]|uniref:Uncharacterized protein n=1 Tax=Trapa incisa TaxID=236973 RepID=A0AAN7L1S2_9MYRT|nr:hypothetical protein SAY87_016749 [Trapa incisa]
MHIYPAKILRGKLEKLSKQLVKLVGVQFLPAAAMCGLGLGLGGPLRVVLNKSKKFRGKIIILKKFEEFNHDVARSFPLTHFSPTHGSPSSSSLVLLCISYITEEF